ncbi:hypothetical protein HDU96_000702 [Phlyctochytrium bullatum]|nr:hypothetical protein HDU96_000702 [Phlyctochytrium bullatum]
MRTLIVAVVAGLLPLASANPFLHTPNALRLDGSQCPVPVRKNMACPILCTTDINLCPTAVKPVCPAGQSWCKDGTCRTSCASGLGDAVCSCGRGYFFGQTDGKDAFFPCNVTAKVRVDVEYFAQLSNGTDDVSGVSRLFDACAKSFKVNFTRGTNTNLFPRQCKPIEPSRTFTTPLAPEFVISYAILIFELVLLGLHLAYKRFRERNVVNPAFGASGASFAASPTGVLSLDPFGKKSQGATAASLLKNANDTEVELAEMSSGDVGTKSAASKGPNPNLRFVGYRNDPIGAAAGATVTLISIVWILLMLVLILDYYQAFARLGFRAESDMIFYDHDLLSTVFIVVWHIVTVWFIFVKLGQERSKAYFGIRVPISQAQYVIVEKREDKAVHLANMGKMVEMVWRVEARIKKALNMEVSVTTCPIHHTHANRRYIEHECLRYVYNDRSGTFEPFDFPVGPSCGDLHRQAGGLLSAEANDRIDLVGPNAIAFPADTLWSALKKEFSGVFYVYQLMFLLICYYAYYYMGLVLTAVIVVSGFTKVLVFLKAQERVLAMANFVGSVKVLRNATWTELSTRELVPGDVIEVVASTEHVLPVDAVLVDGGAVCDESSLTGEALPVVKFPVQKDDGILFRAGEDSAKNNSLFAGCFVLQTQPSRRNAPVLAIVTATGSQTSKGRLVKDILYPSAVSFVFNEHLKVVFPSLMIWGIIMLFASVAMIGTQGVDSWFYGMFTISQVLSPLLPAVLVIGQSVASERLAKNGIVCVDLDRITLAGKVKVFCFDKTGTLTKEGLNFLGVQPIRNTGGAPKFEKVLQDFTMFPDHLRRAMLTCHSVSTVGSQFVGNFVDVEMFRATGASLSASAESSTGGDQGTMVYPTTAADRNLHIVKRFEFVHSHAYMSVLVRDPADGKLHVYLKGSFEKLRDLADPTQIPDDYLEAARFHASEGCYVLAFARRELPASVTLDEAVRMKREELEAGAVLAGLVLFRNELKPDTADALDELRDGGCRVVMITGDNADTAVFIAKSSGMIRRSEYGEPIVLMADLNADKTGVTWKNTETGADVSWQTLESMLLSSRNGGKPVELAMTGKAFNILLKDGRIRNLLLDTRIFARMSPEDKVNCVRLHMEKAVTAMCGDGGNDAGALKASHAGIALSEAESSVVSHFSSRNRSVFACVELLKEARCSLDISFASYKYLIMYGEVLTFLGLIQYYFVVNLSQAMWVLIDGTTVPLSWALTMARPAPRLARTRPTARLLGPETIISVCGQIFINILFLIFAVVMLFNQDWFRCNEFDGRLADVRRWWELGDNFEGSVTGIIGTFQIIHAAAVFNIGRTYRQGFFRNWKFVVVWAIIVFILSFITLADPNGLSCLFHVNCGTSAALEALNRERGTSYQTSFLGIPDTYHAFAGHNVMPMNFRLSLLALSAGNLLALVLFQWLVVLGPVRQWAKRKWPLQRLAYRV